MAVQNNSHPSANGDDDIGVGNKLNFYPAVDEDYETRRAEQQAESLIPLKEDLAEWIQRLLGQFLTLYIARETHHFDFLRFIALLGVI